MTTELQKLLIGLTTTSPEEHITNMVSDKVDVDAIYADREFCFRKENKKESATEAEIIALLKTKQYVQPKVTPVWEFEGYDSKEAYDAKEYARLRKAKYDLLNQDEMRYDDVKNSTTTWVDAIDTIKAAHPKP